MKVAYLIAGLIFALGLGLLCWGTSSTSEVSLLGVTFPPRIAKGLGIIAMIFSVITFLATSGDFQAPGCEEHRERLADSKGNSHNHREDLTSGSHTSHHA
ncbi:MAG TPA: hypothetical protein VGX03_00670 [Candidatus Binatia bacterium]|nr:hypothetical protein [Candidatus Binatia bacterium]